MKVDLINNVYASQNASDTGDHHLYVEPMYVTNPSRFITHFSANSYLADGTFNIDSTHNSTFPVASHRLEAKSELLHMSVPFIHPT